MFEPLSILSAMFLLKVKKIERFMAQSLQKALLLRVEDFYEFYSVDSKNQLGEGCFIRARRRDKNLRGCKGNNKISGKGNEKDMCKPISTIKYPNDYDYAFKIINKQKIWNRKYLLK